MLELLGRKTGGMQRLSPPSLKIQNLATIQKMQRNSQNKTLTETRGNIIIGETTLELAVMPSWYLEIIIFIIWLVIASLAS